MIYNSVTQLIGSSPVVRISNIDTKGAEIYAKLERFNPFGSSKDRAALFMLKGAVERGQISTGATIIEPTSGNTGCALAALAGLYGMKAVIVMPENMSKERIQLMKCYGAEVILTPQELGMKGAIAKAEQLKAETENAFIPSQFDNPDNSLAHYSTTAAEIEEDFGDSLDRFVAGIGSGASLSGVARYFREHGLKARMVGYEPAASPVITEGRAGRHRIPGTGAGFIPANFDASVVDEVVTVTDEEAAQYTRQLARREGILAGLSSGAALAAAIKTSRPGEKVLAFMPDTGERYLSLDFWSE